MSRTKPTHADRQALVAQLSPRDREHLMWWGIARGGARAKQALNWVTSLRDVILSLQSGPTDAMASLFWLRLKNTVDEFRSAYAPQLIVPPTDPNDPHEANA